MVTIPQYDEISLKSKWPVVKNDPNVAKHFPEYSKKQLPSWNFFWNVKFY